MAGDRLNGFSSAFDDALAQNRRQLDELLNKSQSSTAVSQRARPSTRTQITPPQAARPRSATATHTSGIDARRFDADASAAVQRLQARFGNDWRYDIVEQFREGDECIVRCLVTIPSSGVNKSQFGAAHIGGTSVSGAADGVSFSLQVRDAAAQSAQAAEQSAFQQAVEDALTRCEQML